MSQVSANSGSTYPTTGFGGQGSAVSTTPGSEVQAPTQTYKPGAQMAGVFRSLSALILGMVLLMLGNSLVAITVPLEMDRAGYPNWLSGIVMSVYFGGFAFGAIWGQSLIRQIGFIRTFGVFATIFSAAVVMHPLLFNPIAWGIARFAAGLCISGLFLVIEAWLNARTPTMIRGTILGLYTTIVYITQAVGTPLVNLFTVGEVTPYLIATLFLSLSLIPIMMTRVPAPDQPDTSPMGVKELLGYSPLAPVGSFASGILMGCFYSLSAIFGREAGMTIAETTLFTSAMIFGGIVSMFPIGWLADKVDRRIVLVIILLGGVVASLLIVVLAGAGGPARILIALSALFGVFAAPVYGIVITQAYDYLEPEQYVSAAAGLLTAFAVGSFLGPLLTGFLMSATGPGALFVVTGITSAGLAVYTGIRIGLRSALPAEDQESVTVMPRTSAQLYELDPRSDGEEPELDFGPSGQVPR